MQRGQTKNKIDIQKKDNVSNRRDPIPSTTGPRVRLENRIPTPHMARTCPPTEGAIPREDVYDASSTCKFNIEKHEMKLNAQSHMFVAVLDISPSDKLSSISSLILSSEET